MGGDAAHAAKAQGAAFGDAGELDGKQGGVGGEDDDDAAVVRAPTAVVAVFLGQSPSHGQAVEQKVLHVAEVRLDENPEGVAAVLRVEDAAGRADAALKIAGDHARAAA